MLVRDELEKYITYQLQGIGFNYICNFRDMPLESVNC